MGLSKRDLRFIKHRLAGEMMTYISYAALDKLREGHEKEHLEYLMGLSKRLDAAEEAAPDS